MAGDAIDPAPAPAVVVVTHRHDRADVDRCLSSIRAEGGVGTVVVVDNSGHTRTFDLADVVVRCPNDGYGAAFNRGCRKLGDPERAGGVIVLNDDTTVEPGWIEPLVTALADDPNVGAAQPLIVAADAADTVVSAGVELDRWFAGTDIGREANVAAFDHAHDISIFTGGAVLFRAAYLEALGGFDERYFLYYEDVDLALRGIERGWRHRLVPESKVRHTGGASVAALADDLRRIEETSRLRCAARHGSLQALLLACWMSVRRLRHHPRRAHIAALVAGLGACPSGRWERRRARPRSERSVVRMRRRARRFIIRRRRPSLPGVNVLGPRQAASGLGVVTRTLTRLIRAGGLDVVELDSEGNPRVPSRLHPTTIAVVPALQLPLVLDRFPDLTAATDRLIGYWFWELADVPESHVGPIRMVDEIWAPTRFIADAYASAPAKDLPSITEVALPPPLPTLDPVATDSWRERLIGDDDLLVLTSLDLLSVIERKNPLGAIEAFRRAMQLPGVPRARLVVKTINGDRRPEDLRRIEEAAERACEDLGRSAVHVVDEKVEEADLDAMIAAADCFVSLHRAEGLGLHLTTAMAVGTPVIATGWSGSLTHAHEGTAIIIGYELVPVTDGRGAYPSTLTWADPDLNEAADALRRILSNRKFAEQLTTAAHIHLRQWSDESSIASALAEQLAAAAVPSAARSRRGKMSS